MATLLNPEEIQKMLVNSGGWSLLPDKKIQKEFVFKDFAGALEFANRVGALAEAMEHHPDIFLHDYKFVTLTLTTHDAKASDGQKATGLTRMDFDLAAKIENAFA
jgi:4a-hydroxytetrahydrobiopterin dehydratase